MIGNVASVTTSDTDCIPSTNDSCVAPSKFGYCSTITLFTMCAVICSQLILNVSGAEASRQGVQKSRQREEMQRAIRDSGQ